MECSGNTKPPAGRDKGAEDGVEPDWRALGCTWQSEVCPVFQARKLLMTVEQGNGVQFLISEG